VPETLPLDNGLGQRGPAMGWSSWNCHGPRITAQILKDTADAMAANGLRDAGYRYVNLDDGWAVGRNASGYLLPSPKKFPQGMKDVADHVHRRGTLFGIYTARGAETCQKLPGSLGHEVLDAALFAEWGVDYLKDDTCSGSDEPEVAWQQYEAMRRALNKTGRPVWYSITQRMFWNESNGEPAALAPMHNSHNMMQCAGATSACTAFTVKPWLLAGHDPRALANSYLIEYLNNAPRWGGTPGPHGGFLSQLDSQALLTFDNMTTPGAYSDCDMLEVCNGGLSTAESRSQFSTFAILTSPLILGNELRNLSSACAEIVLNKEIIALNHQANGAEVQRGRLVYQFPDAHWPTAAGTAEIVVGSASRQPLAPPAMTLASLSAGPCNEADPLQSFVHHPTDGTLRLMADNASCLTYGGYHMSNVGVALCEPSSRNGSVPGSQSWQLQATGLTTTVTNYAGIGNDCRSLSVGSCGVPRPAVSMCACDARMKHANASACHTGVVCGLGRDFTLLPRKDGAVAIATHWHTGFARVQSCLSPAPLVKPLMNITLQAWAKNLSGGAVGAVVLNRADHGNASLRLTWEMLGIEPGTAQSVRDLWRHQDLGTFVNTFDCEQVPSHDVRVFRLVPVKSVKSVNPTWLKTDDVQPVVDLVLRNFGTTAATSVTLSLSNDTSLGCAPPCFALRQEPKSAGGNVLISASSIDTLSYAVGYYTRFSCGLTLGWVGGGNSFTNSSRGWPCHAGLLKPMTMARAVPYTFQDNVCTHSYSYVWFDQAAWMKHIDWMALAGVNVFLALTGQEEIQYKTFLKFGLKDQEIREWFNGPAYLAWSRGQNIQGVGASAIPENGDTGLPRSWMLGQWRLQKQILNRTRSLGMIGVLPAFQGNLPPQIKSLNPQANISTIKKNVTKGNCAWVASTDPLFGEVADTWMQTMLSDFGTDHWYQADGLFLSGKVPWLAEANPEMSFRGHNSGASPDTVDPKTVVADPNWTPVWKGAWGGISRTDPLARWLYQGWQIREWGDAAGAARLKALYETVPHGQWIVIDMDQAGLWRKLWSFFSAPFIWTALENMGGNDVMKGDMRQLVSIPSDALSANATTCIGTGATPEGVNQNPAYWEYLYDTAWHPMGQPLTPWFAQYSRRRYGLVDPQSSNMAIEAAWQILATAAYTSEGGAGNGGFHDDSGVEWKPGWGTWGSPGKTNLSGLVEAWSLMLEATNSSTVTTQLDPVAIPTFNYDLVNLGREVLAQTISVLILRLVNFVEFGDKVKAMQAGKNLLEAYEDLDNLVKCDPGFLLGVWISDSKRWANASDAPASYFEWQARSQITTWYPIPPGSPLETHLQFLDSYASKHWAGLIRDFYARRVKCYIDHVANILPDEPIPCAINTTGVRGTLKGYPSSLPGCQVGYESCGPSGLPPSTWPYDVKTLQAAQAWCCAHDDCGGVVLQSGRYEVRGATYLNTKASTTAFPRNLYKSKVRSNLTRCIAQIEETFGQDTVTQYDVVPTNHATVAVSRQMYKKYSGVLTRGSSPSSPTPTPTPTPPPSPPLPPMPTPTPPSPPSPSVCMNSTGVPGTFILGYPPSLGHNHTMPFNDRSLASAQAWCCTRPYDDCGGIMFEFDKYTARAGHEQKPDPSHPCMTWLRESSSAALYSSTLVYIRTNHAALKTNGTRMGSSGSLATPRARQTARAARETPSRVEIKHPVPLLHEGGPSAKTDDEHAASQAAAAGAMYYKLSAGDLEAADWPQRFHKYTIIITDPGLPPADLARIRRDLPGRKLIAYTCAGHGLVRLPVSGRVLATGR
jgi:alpha-N-acetylglucosaminidase